MNHNPTNPVRPPNAAAPPAARKWAVVAPPSGLKGGPLAVVRSAVGFVNMNANHMHAASELKEPQVASRRQHANSWHVSSLMAMQPQAVTETTSDASLGACARDSTERAARYEEVPMMISSAQADRLSPAVPGGKARHTSSSVSGVSLLDAHSALHASEQFDAREDLVRRHSELPVARATEVPPRDRSGTSARNAQKYSCRSNEVNCWAGNMLARSFRSR